MKEGEGWKKKGRRGEKKEGRKGEGEEKEKEGRKGEGGGGNSKAQMDGRTEGRKEGIHRGQFLPAWFTFLLFLLTLHTHQVHGRLPD
jgi:hypothetical protein